MNSLFAELEKKINHKFKNANLLNEALTHSSFLFKNIDNKNINYERLEFLGDRVLGLVLAEYFFNFLPDAKEELLDNYLQNYANQNTLAKYAKRIDLHKFIKIQKGDNLEYNSSILSDVVESIIASIYLDAGYEDCKKFIINEIITPTSLSSKLIKHPKSLLQEYCLKEYKCLPKYTMVNKTGTDHKPNFKVSVSINNDNNAVSEGSSLKNAEEAAALKLLNILKV